MQLATVHSPRFTLFAILMYACEDPADGTSVLFVSAAAAAAAELFVLSTKSRRRRNSMVKIAKLYISCVYLFFLSHSVHVLFFHENNNNKINFVCFTDFVPLQVLEIAGSSALSGSFRKKRCLNHFRGAGQWWVSVQCLCVAASVSMETSRARRSPQDQHVMVAQSLDTCTLFIYIRY